MPNGYRDDSTVLYSSRSKEEAELTALTFLNLQFDLFESEKRPRLHCALDLINYGLKLATIADRLALPFSVKAGAYDPIDVT